jgi:hypothetical protein
MRPLKISMALELAQKKLDYAQVAQFDNLAGGSRRAMSFSSVPMAPMMTRLTRPRPPSVPLCGAHPSTR